MSRHLVIGASGQVGEHLVRQLHNRGVDVIGTYWKHYLPGLIPLDICNIENVSGLLFQLRPDVVYLPAALTNVDFCELNPNLSYEINVLGICNVMRIVKQTAAKLVYFSSDYVFDGVNGPYSEEAPTRPICEYGHHKLQSEHYIAIHLKDYLILRTTVVYGWESQGKNFVHRLVQDLRKNKNVRVPYDQIGSPSYAPDLAEIAIDLASSDVQGLFNVVGSGLVSRYDFAVVIAKSFGLNADLITPVSTSDLNQVAKRPLKAGMLPDKVQKTLGREVVDFSEGLKRMVNSTDNKGSASLG